MELELPLGFQPLQCLQLASLRCEEEKARNKSEAETKKEKTLWGRILTCSLADSWVNPSDTSQELLQQSQVTMIPSQVPDPCGLLRADIPRYFLFAAKSEVIS